MWDPNEALENDDENYDPMDDDLEFDEHFLDNMSFNEVVEFLDNFAAMFVNFNQKKIIKKNDWYSAYYNNPGQEVLIDVDAGMFEDAENLADNFTEKKYQKMLEQYKKTGQEIEFLKICDITGVTSIVMEKINDVGDLGA